jgi:hypothetical protein
VLPWLLEGFGTQVKASRSVTPLLLFVTPRSSRDPTITLKWSAALRWKEARKCAGTPSISKAREAPKVKPLLPLRPLALTQVEMLLKGQMGAMDQQTPISLPTLMSMMNSMKMITQTGIYEPRVCGGGSGAPPVLSKTEPKPPVRLGHEEFSKGAFQSEHLKILTEIWV